MNKKCVVIRFTMPELERLRLIVENRILHSGGKIPSLDWSILTQIRDAHNRELKKEAKNVPVC